MKRFKIHLFLLAAAAVAGCTTTRSISNAGYRPERTCFGARCADADPAFRYQGELSEFDVLGITRGAVASDTEIERTLAAAKRVRLKPGDSILLIQSGATFPDGPMVAELSKYFRVVPFSGVPPAGRTNAAPFESGNADSFARSLRLAAARGGNDMIVCCWGILESENAKLATKTVSWVPVVNWVVPDEREHMRLRLKLALVDVRTGDWAVLSPEPVTDARLTLSPRRGVTDQKLVESLKQRAYAAGAKELVRRYSDVAVAN
jgi:hypothetical protein